MNWDTQRQWEDFLSVIAQRCGLKGVARDFFIDLFKTDAYLECTINEIATQFHIEFKTCTKTLTTIYGTFKKIYPFKSKNQRKELHAQLCQEFAAYRASFAPHAEARSAIPVTSTEQLHHELSVFNYRKQKAAFHDMLTATQAAQALLVRVNDLNLQKWLVWRLVQQLVTIEGVTTEKPLPLATKASRQWNADPTLFSSWLAKDLACSPSPDCVIEAIVQQCQYRSVVIVIYEVRGLKQFWQFLRTEFWQRLTDRLNQTPCGIDQGRCLLFLASDAGYGCPPGWHTDSVGTKPVLTELMPWETVEAQDMTEWLRNRQRQAWLTDVTGKDLTQIQQDWIDDEELLSAPEFLLRGLGQDLGLEDGIAELVNYWHLAA
jgi:inactive STAND